VNNQELVLFVYYLGTHFLFRYGGQFFTNLGLQKETAATATLGTTTQIVWTYIFELAFLHDGINAWSFGGTGLIMGYMIVMAGLKLVAPSSDGGSREESEPLLTHTSEEIASKTDEA
jgi:drug/metabolite transporter (DMT)-like permease